MKYARAVWLGFTFLVVAFLIVPNVSSLTTESGDAVVTTALMGGQSSPRRQIDVLMGEFRAAGSTELRKPMLTRIRAALEEYKVSPSIKELTPAEREARRQKKEEILRGNPFQWRLHQLRQAIRVAKSREEIDSIRAEMRRVKEEQVADAEAKLTPEQRLERQARKEKASKIKAELKTIVEQLRAAETPDERKRIRAQMIAVFERYK